MSFFRKVRLDKQRKLQAGQFCTIMLFMTEYPNEDPIWVAEPEHLQRVVDILAGYDKLAIDTESNGLFVYKEQVCLVQISTPDADYLIDSLAIPDLSPLESLFSNPRIEKIFHAAEYDLIGFKRDHDFSFVNIFDTMLAGRILGKKGLGLASMLSGYFGIELDKRFQRANWGKRPLPPEQLAYARLDSHFLIALRELLNKELAEKNLLDLAEEDFIRMCDVRVTTPENCFSNFWRIPGREELSAQQYAVLHALCEYRDQRAKAVNRPVFKVFGNKTLVDIAQRLPASHRELNGIIGFPPSQIRRYGDGILNAVQRGLKSEPLYKPNRSRPSMDYLNRLDMLKKWRKDTACDLGVESDVVLPRDILEEIAKENPSELSRLKGIMQEIPWRYNHFGREILALLKEQE